MNDKLKVFFASIACICLLYAGLFSCVRIHAFSSSFYQSQNCKLEISENINVSKEDYKKSMQTLLDYIRGEREDMKVVIQVKDVEKEAFNARETSHMVDVRKLYLDARLLTFFAIGVAICLLLVIYFDKPSDFLEIVSTSFLRVCVVLLFILCGLVVYALVDFTAFWTKFHELFFNNDLWLLNPRTDLMIQMLPEEIFFALIIRIVSTFIGVYLIMIILSIWYLKVKRKRFFLLSI